MVQTATAWLQDKTRHWTPSPAQFQGARTHRAAIQTRLEIQLGIYGMFEIGSLRHGTGIWQHSDADYLVSLRGARPSDPWTALNRVKYALQGRYPTTSIAVRQPAVVCHFSDGYVEVVPGYHDGTGYWIPNPTGGWMKTFPMEHNAWVNDINSRFNGGAKALARQLKLWKYKRDVPVSSCYLEMRAAKHLDGESTYAPVWDLYLALKKMRDAELAALNDPTGLSSRFAATSSPALKTIALSKLTTAVSRAHKVKEYDAAGLHVSAVTQLQLLFNL